MPFFVTAILLLSWASREFAATQPPSKGLDPSRDGPSNRTDSASNVRKTPPMGWNSWIEFGKGISAKLVEEIADGAKKYRLDELGYKYLGIDDGWQQRELGPKGELVPNPTTFPHGIAPVTRYVRQRGFELGIYTSPNILTCASLAGSLGHETVHVRQFAEWGCRFVKYDYCPVRNGEAGLASDKIVGRYREFGDTLKANAPDILFAICEKGWAGQVTKRQRTKNSPPITWQQRFEAFAWCKEVGGVMWRTTLQYCANFFIRSFHVTGP